MKYKKYARTPRGCSAGDGSASNTGEGLRDGAHDAMVSFLNGAELTEH